MDKIQVEYLDLKENKEYYNIINTVILECFKTEKIKNKNLYVSFTLTTPEHIKDLNKEHRNIDKQTDVLSFPMFEKDEINSIIGATSMQEEVLGDIVISIKRVEEQAIEYGHSFKRELSYMTVHGFYHIMGYDHIKEEDKKIMRQKEKYILDKLSIGRD